jgi:YaiO family outer membrane protein
MKTHALIALCLVLAAGWPGPDLRAQAPEPGPAAHWQAATLYLLERLPDRSDWHTFSLNVGRIGRPATVLFEIQSVERDHIRQHTLGTDLYYELPAGGYMNVRGQVATGDILPRVLAAVDLLHPVRGGWEGAIGYEHRRYPLETVHTVRVGPGLYAGSWYLRTRHSLTRASGETALASMLFARRLIADSPADYVEVGGGLGREFVEMVPAGTGRVEVDARTTRVLHARTQQFLTTTLGVAAGAGYQSYHGLGARPWLMLGLLGRW